MSLPSSTKKLVEHRLQEYCEKKFPPEVSNEIQLKFKIRGNSVTLLEERMAFAGLAKWVDITVAQFRFDPKTKKWALYWADRNDRWHEYDDLSPDKDLDVLLNEVD